MSTGRRKGALAATATVLGLALALLLVGLGSARQALEVNGRRAAEEAVRRAAVTCYALEGAYPESYDYLKAHYGVAVNERRYLVSYSIFAANLMPDISVEVLPEGVG